MEPAESYIETRNIISYIASGFSFLGVAYIMTIYIAFKSIREKVLFRIMANIAIADIISVIGGIYLSPTMDTTNSEFNLECTITGSILVYGTMSSLFWTISFALKVFQVIVNEQPYERLIRIRWSFWVCVLFPATASLGLFLFSYTNQNTPVFGYTEVYCTISTSYEYSFLLVSAFFYIPGIVALIANTILYIKIFRTLKKMSLSFQWAFVCMFYPIFLFVMMFISMMNRILLEKYDTSVEILLYIHVGLAQWHGFFDAIIYGVNPSVKYQIKRSFIRHSKKVVFENVVQSELQQSLKEQVEERNRDDSECWVK